MTTKPADVDAYLATLPPATNAVATTLRSLIHGVVPDAVESIRYGMPAFSLGGGRYLYFAAWKRHLSLYPIYRGTGALEADVTPYRYGQDTLRFSLAEALPLPLITRIVRAQAEGEAR